MSVLNVIIRIIGATILTVILIILIYDIATTGRISEGFINGGRQLIEFLSSGLEALGDKYLSNFRYK